MARHVCLWALAHLLLGLPLNLLLLPKVSGASATASPSAKPHVPMDRVMWLLGFAFAAGWFVSTAMAAHLPRLLESAGATTAQAIAAASLVGPAQVAARVLEASYHPLVSGRLSTLTHPVGTGALLIGGGWLAMPFTLLHGAGNGILTIARGTVPLAVFGPENYGYRLGLLGAPARILQAGAPIAFGLLIDRFGALALLFSSLTCMAATAALLAVTGSAKRTRKERAMSATTTAPFAQSARHLVLLVCFAQTLVPIGAFFWPALLPQLAPQWGLSNSG